MPELPEVEVVCRSLEKKIIGKTIVSCEVFLPKLIKTPSVKEFEQRLKGQTIERIARRGKYIQIFTTQGDVLVVHLRMTGKLLLTDEKQALGKYAHICFLLDNTMQLVYDDIRQFGTLYLVKENELDTISGLCKLGVEPLSDAFTVDVLRDKMKGKSQKIKSFLLDQHNIAGIGNIYADEILFQAKIHPQSTTGAIEDICLIEALHKAIQEKLQLGIEYGGSSIKDYVDADGNSGSFQNMHKVYGKAGQSCSLCGNKLDKIQAAGRGSVVCNHCQIKY